MSRGFREKVAVSLLGAAVVMGAVLGVMAIRSFTQPTTELATATGQVAGAQAGAGASPAEMPGAPGSTGGSSSGGSGGVAGGTVTIGGFFDITGPVDSSVERDTVRAYMQAVNASGGINGRQVQYVWCDSKYDASSAHSCAQYLIAQNVLAVVGLTAPLGENNEIKTLTSAGIPVIGGLGTPAEYNDPLSFPVSANFYRYGTAIADEAKTLGAKHPAVVVLGDVPWVHPVEANLLNRLAADGIGYTDVEEVSATQANYTGTVFNLQHSHHGPSGGGAQPSSSCSVGQPGCPDYVIAALDPFSYHRLFDAMEAANWYPGVLGTGLDKFSVQRSYDGELKNAHSLVPFLSPYDHQGNPTVRQYLGTVQHFYPGQFQALDIYTQHAWTAAMVFVEAARKAGKELSRDSLVQALNGLENFQTGWSVPLSYGAGAHDPNHCFTYTANNGSGWHTTSGWICS
ncbi:MAG TPA: ABC transporter substrate-binding protein [Candidatus Dormibacteraeota bacterium]|nr:ABC transporter substrate-binding protein [Candidatus Dormibacteraeota bacterium]